MMKLPPVSSPSFWAKALATVSVDEPAAKATTMVTGLALGQSGVWANSDVAHRPASANKP